MPDPTERPEHAPPTGTDLESDRRMRSGRLYRPRCPLCGSADTRPAHAVSNACVALFNALSVLAGVCPIPTRAAWTCRTCGERFEDDAD